MTGGLPSPTVAIPAIAIAIGIWWNANTIAHLFIHRPFFRRRPANAAFAALLSGVLGFPQSFWRDRHLAHHGGVPYRFRSSRELWLQAGVVLSLWAGMLTTAPEFFVFAYIPGYAMGLLLCAIHGHYEHAGGTTSHYGRLYNLLCCNEGYHVEHHLHPCLPWGRLPAHRAQSARGSAWPAPLRWIEHVAVPMSQTDHPIGQSDNPITRSPNHHITRCIVGLEHLVLRSRALQRFVLRSHAQAFGDLLATLPHPHHVAIVGGGLFPRSALIVRRLLPAAGVTIIDASSSNLDRARLFLADERVTFVHGRYDAGAIVHAAQRIEIDARCDLILFPLAFDGDREAIYARPPAPAIIVHDWIWRKRGASRVVSVALLKRMNLVRR